MAASQSRTTQYTTSNLTESAGVVLFDPSAEHICLLHYKAKDEYLLPKGRRNIGESRAQASVREAKEETGLGCRLLPVTAETRQPLATDAADAADAVREVRAAEEPFLFTLRELGRGRVKVIWWYVAVVDRDGGGGYEDGGEAQFEARWFSFDEAAERLTFESDREVVREGVRLYGKTVSGRG